MRQNSRQRRQNEGIPLLQKGKTHKGEVSRYMDPVEEDEYSPWVDIVVSPDRQMKGTSLIVEDCILLVVQYLQLYGVLQSMGLRWPWPTAWLNWSATFFFVNIDIWEFLKIYTKDVFIYKQDYDIPSAEIGIDYMHLVIGWGIVVFLGALLYVILYCVFTRMRRPRTLYAIAQMQRAYIIGLQVLSLPIGLVAMRLFHCTPAEMVDVKNEEFCFLSTHWAYLAPSIVVLILVFIIFPAWLILKIKSQLLNMSDEEHESYLQLKEMEYLHGLDMIWIIGGFQIFASYRRPGVHYRAALVILYGLILAVYGALHQHSFIQIVIINCILFIMFIGLVAVRPFRIKIFNFMLAINFLCLSFNALLGCFKSSFEATTIVSVWLLPSYQIIILAAINGFWLFCLLLFLIYVGVRTVCWQKSVVQLWPNQKYNDLSPQTRRYVRGIIVARLLAEKSMKVHPMFSPVHELARYIHIINAYCREAEYTGDSMLHPLWDVLDHLIEIHTHLAPKSLFAESTKDSIRLTAEELMKMLPMFVQRLAQREYDFILMRPVRRRILLKLYCISLFLHGKWRHVERSRLVVPATKKVWKNANSPLTVTDGDNYFEEIYPPPEPITSNRVYAYDTDILLELEKDNDFDDEVVIEETEEWLQQHGIHGNKPTLADEWRQNLGLESRPSTTGSLSIREQDFTIPGFAFTEEELKGSSGSSGKPGSAKQSRPGSRSGSTSPASIGSRPQSAASKTFGSIAEETMKLPGANSDGRNDSEV